MPLSTNSRLRRVGGRIFGRKPKSLTFGYAELSKFRASELARQQRASQNLRPSGGRAETGQMVPLPLRKENKCKSIQTLGY